MSRTATSPPVGSTTLPPGQRRVDGFPRFGTHLAKPPPPVPADPVIAIRGAVAEAVDFPVAALADLPRRALTADFHCVAGWSATDVRWGGVPFAALYRAVVEPILRPGEEISHIVFRGLDGYASVVWIEDALADGVLVADQLDGRPLGGAHGAPARLVSPAQYGYMSVKHLCGIEVRTSEPTSARKSFVDAWLLRSHPRARVEHEERHGLLPGRLVRPFYAALKRPLLALTERGWRSP
jgi:DMSO/TMAO reductase YedYZ molybdopterin-dependent catalytic subunit